MSIVYIAIRSSFNRDSPCITGEESLDGRSDPLGAGGAVSARLVRAADEQRGARAPDGVRPVMKLDKRFIRIQMILQ